MAEFGTLSFSGDAETCYGLFLVSRAVESRGHVVRSNAKAGRMLVSLYWMEQVYDLIKWRKDNVVQDDIELTAGGNCSTTYPNATLPFVSRIWLGDGDRYDPDSENHLTVDTPARPINVESELSPRAYEDAQSNKRAFVEISRGCKHKCLFCQYGWMKPYRESDITDILAVIKTSRTKSVRVFAADRFQHSKYSTIRSALKGKCDTGSDASVHFVMKHPELLAITRKLRVGIEGMSERLRKLVGKPLRDDQIVEFVRLAIQAGIKTMDWYMIYGLPTETPEDWESYRELMTKIASAVDRYSIAIHWNAFTPASLTPFQWAPSAYGYPVAFSDAIKSVRFSNLNLMHKPMMTGPRTLTKRMLAIRSTPDTAQMLFSLALKPSGFDSHDKICDEYERRTGKSLHGAWPTNDALPWDRYVVYERDRMKRLWDHTTGSTS
jgi:hypothetical protein